MEKQLNRTKEILKELVNDENATKIAEIGEQLDQLEQEYKKVNDDYNGLKDSYIQVVKNTALKEHKENNDIQEEHKSLDDIMNESLMKVVNKN